MSNRDMERYRCFSRRATIIGGAKLALLSALGARLGWLQIIQGDKYKTLSDKNRISMRFLPAERGQITDRFGVPLATNVQNFQSFLVAEQSPDITKTLQDFSRLVPLTEEEIAEIIARTESKRSFTPVLVKDNLDWDSMARIEVNLPDLPGISTAVGKIRSYPLAEATAHSIGYVGLVSDTEIDKKDPVTTLPGYRIGKTGIEKTHDKILRGTAGSHQIEVNVVGREIRELSRTEGQNGTPIKLTLDAELQIYCQNRLAQEKSAACVIMDIHSGALYALCSSPGFDPNVFTRRISASLWEELLANPAVPLTNKPVSGQYPPGSTFKMVTALAALEHGIIHGGTTHFCSGHLQVGRDRFHCWKRGGHGKVNLRSALEQSCDVFFYEIARKLEIDKLAAMAHKLGLGEKLGLEIPGEAPGLIPTKDWKRGQTGKKWQLGETIISTIGQGYLLSTPLQLATMTARLVNGGYAVKPFLTAQIGGQPVAPTTFEKLNFNDYHLHLVKKGMEAVTMGKKGTARGAKIQQAGYSMAGKTGTSQVKRITREQRAQGIRNEDLPWKDRHHALFVGYGPVKKPRYACAVIVEHGVAGGSVAAPVARDILHQAQRRDPAKKTKTEAG